MLSHSRTSPQKLPESHWKPKEFLKRPVAVAYFQEYYKFSVFPSRSSSKRGINNADRLRRRMRCHPWIVSPLLRKDESIRGCWNALVMISFRRPMVKADSLLYHDDSTLIIFRLHLSESGHQVDLFCWVQCVASICHWHTASLGLLDGYPACRWY
jgi:hypothetical protein